jgi:hypothetical protein
MSGRRSFFRQVTETGIVTKKILIAAGLGNRM